MEDLEKKLELTEEILEELGKVMKLLKKGSNPLIGYVFTNDYCEKINAQIRQVKSPFRRLGKNEISDSRGDVTVGTRELMLLRALPLSVVTKGEHTGRYIDAKGNILELIPLYEDLIMRMESIRDELLILTGRGDASSNS